MKEDKVIEVSFKKIPKNPNTLDNIWTMVIIGIISLVTIVGIIIYRKKKEA